MSGDDQGTLPSEDPREALARPTPASAAGTPGQERLRILIANDDEALVERVRTVVTDLGHEVVAHVTDISVVGARAVELAADLALVALNAQDVESNDRGTHALELISQIVHEARCPVIAVIENENPEFIARAASKGISAYACPIRHEEVMGAVNVALGRFLEHRKLEDAFQRRAVIERAKGILMERNLIDEREAFERLRSHARSSSQPLIDLAEGCYAGIACSGSAQRDQRRGGGPTLPAPPEGENLASHSPLLDLSLVIRYLWQRPSQLPTPVSTRGPSSSAERHLFRPHLPVGVSDAGGLCARSHGIQARRGHESWRFALSAGNHARRLTWRA